MKYPLHQKIKKLILALMLYSYKLYYILIYYIIFLGSWSIQIAIAMFASTVREVTHIFAKLEGSDQPLESGRTVVGQDIARFGQFGNNLFDLSSFLPFYVARRLMQFALNKFSF